MSSSSTGSLQDRILALYGIRDWPKGASKAASRHRQKAGAANHPSRNPAGAGQVRPFLLGGAGIRKAFYATVAILAFFVFAIPFVWDSIESADGPNWFFSHPNVVASAKGPVSGIRTTQSGAAALAGKRWAAKNFSGEVHVQAEDGIWRPMTNRDGVLPGTRIETGKTGKIVLRQKGDVLTILPNTRFEVPKHGKRNVALTFGKVLFDMERRPDRRFSVGTTHLVAVVKGTKFAVEADNGGSTVRLTRGAVEVTALKADHTPGDIHLLQPGEVVVASTAGNGKLTIINRNSWQAQ